MANPRLRRSYPLVEATVLAEFLAMPRDAWERLMTVVIDRLDTDGPGPGSDAPGHGHLDRHFNGVWELHARFDALSGAGFANTVHSIVRQLRNDARLEGVDAPTTSELIVHALLEMARRAADHHDANPNTPNVNITVTEDAVADAMDLDDDDLDRGDADGDDRDVGDEALDDDMVEDAMDVDDGDGDLDLDEPGCPHGCTDHDPAPAPATVDGAPLTKRQLRRVLCEGILHGLVLDSNGAILRLGRTRRDPSPEQRLYLALRDQGCSFPGCTKPPSLCFAHHIIWWSQGGPTDIDHLCLVCARHHTLIHNGLYQPRVEDGIVLWTNQRTGRQLAREPPSMTIARYRRNIDTIDYEWRHIKLVLAT
jgi:hypothetical protein